MPPNHFESEVESFLEGSHGDRTHIKRADHHTVTPLCGTLLAEPHVSTLSSPAPRLGPPAPKQPAGPQATASATQQHVVSYNPSVIMGT